MSLKSFECAVLPVKKLCHWVIPIYHDDQFFPEEAQEGEEFYGADDCSVYQSVRDRNRGRSRVVSGYRTQTGYPHMTVPKDEIPK
uniref:Uncharacterized protein n=1 Tax=Oryza rufipogon TaxID=4529 RepID=A0A0E0PWM0_ORYRU